jgi:hypothetical protein
MIRETRGETVAFVALKTLAAGASRVPCQFGTIDREVTAAVGGGALEMQADRRRAVRQAGGSPGPCAQQQHDQPEAADGCNLFLTGCKRHQ